MPEATRILFVDDEPLLRTAWSEILAREGFRVTAASSVAEALVLITSEQFQVLLADLNIGQPGDGFTIASAMRRVQPQVVTLILTGYPEFEGALRAIHNQVDDFLVKPPDRAELLECIQRNLAKTRHAGAILPERLADVISANKAAIIERWYTTVEMDSELGQITLTREERIDHLPEVLDELVQPGALPHRLGAEIRNAASKHGHTRRNQGYTPALLLEEGRILHNMIAEQAHRNLLRVDLSKLLPDLLEVDDRLHRMLRYSLEAFLTPNNASKAA
jgi:DNA-binding response OmpR family regulator